MDMMILQTESLCRGSYDLSKCIVCVWESGNSIAPQTTVKALCFTDFAKSTKSTGVFASHCFIAPASSPVKTQQTQVVLTMKPTKSQHKIIVLDMESVQNQQKPMVLAMEPIKRQ